MGNQTHNTPPTTSISDNKANSAAGKNLEPIEYKIKPEHTKMPCNENKNWFLSEEINSKSLMIITSNDIITQANPAKATVLKVGAFFFHLRETEKIAKQKADNKPKTSPVLELTELWSKDIITIPTEATIIEKKSFKLIISFNKKKPSNAVTNGIAAKQSKVIAALVLVIDTIKHIIPKPRKVPPTNDDKLVFK